MSRTLLHRLLPHPPAVRHSSQVQMNDTNGRSKGWGKVLFVSVELADRARVVVNRTVLDERKISVRFDSKHV